MRILIEASGSLVSGYLIKTIQNSGHVVVASDIDDFNHAKQLADDFIVFPKSNHPNLWDIIEKELISKKIDLVIPSFDATLLQWAQKKEYFSKLGIHVIVSQADTIEIFSDKWKTYTFFDSLGVLTPKSSLNQDFSLVKPRWGRGGSGIYIGDEKQNMNDMISQEFIKGIEYTVDCFFDNQNEPIYIIPRQRLDIKDGKSTKGVVVQHPIIEEKIIEIAKKLNFLGPINFQCIETQDKEIYFIEVNPRIAGGMALGIEASENWVSLIVDNIINNQEITPKPINYGLKMVRYYDECFI